MLDILTPVPVSKYNNKINKYAKLYGKDVLAIIYQRDVRCQTDVWPGHKRTFDADPPKDYLLKTGCMDGPFDGYEKRFRPWDYSRSYMVDKNVLSVVQVWSSP